MEKLNMNPYGLSALSFDPVLLEQMKADTYNAIAGVLTGYDCPLCKNKGSIAYLRNGEQLAMKTCSCMRIRRCVWEMEKSGLQKSIRELTFDAFQATQPWQQTIKKGAMDYAAKLDGWLLLCGQSGSGKTHLCTAVCRQRLLQGDEVRYMPWREQVSQIKACALDSQERGRIMGEYKCAGILYIDDLYKGGETPTGADIGITFELINYRYINHLHTIVSTERTPQELIAIDQATGSRLIEMAGVNVFDISKDLHRNYRLRHIRSL